MAEKFGLEQALADRTHVDGEEYLSRPRGHRVQPPRDEFLAGAILAEDEHVGVGRRRALMSGLTAPDAWRNASLARRSVAVSLRLRRNSTPVDTVATTFSFCQGLVTKSVAPSFIASTALSTLP
jgi:hypothetical protein